MKRKFFKLVLAFAMVFGLGFVLASCNANDVSTTTSSQNTNTPTTTTTNGGGVTTTTSGTQAVPTTTTTTNGGGVTTTTSSTQAVPTTTTTTNGGGVTTTTSGTQAVPTTTTSQSGDPATTTTTEEVFAIDANYYAKLLDNADKRTVIIKPNDLVINSSDTLKVEVSNDSYINLTISNDTLIGNGYIKIERDEKHKSVLQEAWLALNGEVAMVRTVRATTPKFNRVYLNGETNDEEDDLYEERVQYKEISLSKDSLFALINKVAQNFDPTFDINDVDFNEIISSMGDSAIFSREAIANTLTTVLGMFFDSEIGEETVSWTFKYDMFKTAATVISGLTVSDIVDMVLGTGTYDKLLTLCDPEEEFNIGTIRLGDLLISDEEDSVGFVNAEQIDTFISFVMNSLPTIASMLDLDPEMLENINPTMITGLVSQILGVAPYVEVEVTAWDEDTVYFTLNDGDYTAVNTETVTQPVEGTKYYVVATLGELLTSDEVQLLTINQVALNVYSFIQMMINASNPNFDPSKLPTSMNIAAMVYPYLATYGEKTIFDIIGEVIDSRKSFSELEFVEVEVDAWDLDTDYFTFAEGEYEIVDKTTITNPVEGTKYYVVKLTTGEDVYDKTIAAIEQLEEMLTITFTTDYDASIKEARIAVNTNKISGELVFDFATEYTDTVTTDLLTYLPYANEYFDGTVEPFAELFNDDIFKNLEGYELVKEGDTIVGFTKSGHTYLFEPVEKYVKDQDGEKLHLYGTVWKYMVELYDSTDDTLTGMSFKYDSATQAFLNNVEYDEGVVVQEGDEKTPRIVKYTNKAFDKDFYYYVTYPMHTISSWNVEEIVDDYGNKEYKITAHCSSCDEDLLVATRAGDKWSTYNYIDVYGIPVQNYYYPVLEEYYAFYKNYNNGNYTNVYSSIDPEIFGGLTPADYSAYKYSNDITIVYVYMTSNTKIDGLIVLDADNNVIDRFGTAVLRVAPESLQTLS